MKIYRYSQCTEIPEESTAVALGFFDGVHAGHKRLLRTARELAKQMNLTFTVFTFPSENGFKGSAALYTTEQKLELLEKEGVEAVVIAEFASIANLSAEDFLEKSLLGDLKCRAAIAGEDFRFGKNALGDTALLQKTLEEHGALCIIEEEHKIDGEKISTTAIKRLLQEGKPEEARRRLEAPYYISCTVEHGNGVGKTLGFPTVNTAFPSGTTPLKKGVYRTAVEIDGRLYNGITNVGNCPTFERRALHAETYIIDYSGNLYGDKIRIFFLGYLREEKRFDDPKQLIMQINVDKNTAIQQNGELKWQEIGLN